MLLMGIICFEKSSCSNIVFSRAIKSIFLLGENKVNFRHFLTYIWCVLSAYCQAGSKLSRSSPYRPLTYTQFLPPFCIDYNRRICTKKNHPQVIGLLFTYSSYFEDLLWILYLIEWIIRYSEQKGLTDLFAISRFECMFFYTESIYIEHFYCITALVLKCKYASSSRSYMSDALWITLWLLTPKKNGNFTWA